MFFLWYRGQLFHVTKFYEWKIPYFCKSRTTSSIKFASWTLQTIEESLSYWLAGLWYSLFEYMTFNWLYPFIQ